MATLDGAWPDSGGPDMYPVVMPADRMEGVGEAFHCIAALAVEYDASWTHSQCVVEREV